MTEGYQDRLIFDVIELIFKEYIKDHNNPIFEKPTNVQSVDREDDEEGEDGLIEYSWGSWRGRSFVYKRDHDLPCAISVRADGSVKRAIWTLNGKNGRVDTNKPYIIEFDQLGRPKYLEWNNTSAKSYPKVIEFDVEDGKWYGYFKNDIEKVYDTFDEIQKKFKIFS